MPLPTHEEILREESARAERGIARFRVALALLAGVTDVATVLGLLPSSGSWPVSTVAVDAAWLVTGLVFVRLARGSVTQSLQIASATADFLFVAASLVVGAMGEGANRDGMVLLGAAAMALLSTVSALRLSVVTTVYATVLGFLGFLAGCAVVRPAGDSAFGGAVTILVQGGLCAYLSHRSWQSSRVMLQRSRLERFLPREIAEQIGLADTGEPDLAGRQMTVTVVFSDLQGFTAMSETLPPEQIVEMLNAIRAAMTRVVFEHLGTLDKFVGDATMAVFGAPLPRPDDAARALRCALAMRAAMHALNAERRARGLPTLEAGIGMHTGTVIAGNVGPPERLEYTVIGDAVNVAARVESLTRKFATDILCTAATREAAGPGFTLRGLGAVEVKGRTAPVEVYAVEG